MRLLNEYTMEYNETQGLKKALTSPGSYKNLLMLDIFRKNFFNESWYLILLIGLHCKEW